MRRIGVNSSFKCLVELVPVPLWVPSGSSRITLITGIIYCLVGLCHRAEGSNDKEKAPGQIPSILVILNCNLSLSGLWLEGNAASWFIGRGSKIFLTPFDD